MKWRYRIQGPHVRVRVFMDGAHCGVLCFTLKEFEEIKAAETWLQSWSLSTGPLVTFIEDPES